VASGRHDDRQEEEEDLFVFNDTKEGPRAPAVLRLSQGASLGGVDGSNISEHYEHI